MPKTEGMKAGGCCYSRAAAMKAGSVPEAVELIKNSGLMSFVAVTEHGARLSRTPKQKSKRKAETAKRLKAKSQASNRAKRPHKSQRRKQKPKA